MLKRLFTSNTRIKLLTVFLTNPNEEFFIRELTRKLDEQINSIRRELDNLKKMGFLRTRAKNRKKYYYINTEFIFLSELKSIFLKSLSNNDTMSKDISAMGKVKLLILTGQFIEKAEMNVDMLLVGDIDREKLAEYLNSEVKTERPVRFSILSEADYEYRLNCNDKFVKDIVNNKENKTLINKI